MQYIQNMQFRRILRQLYQTAEKAKVHLQTISKMSDVQLKNLFALQKAAEIKDESLLVAILSEASFRTIGLRPYQEQIACALAIFNGDAADMKTGEGKSLVAAIGAILHVAYGDKVHIATVNDYLAKRDWKEM